MIRVKDIFSVAEFIKDTLMYIVFPPMCPICREIVDERGQLCEKCAAKSFKVNEKKNLPEDLSGVMRITKYRGGTQKILWQLKFENDLTVLPSLQKMLEHVSDNLELKNFLAKVDVATFVPLHKKRLKERGFNQAELLFKDWLTSKKIFSENLLIRKKSTQKLFSYNFDERRKILKEAFAMAEGVDVRGKNILIVDDIYTTGATTSECARVLKLNGANKIFVLAFASDFEER